MSINGAQVMDESYLGSVTPTLLHSGDIDPLGLKQHMTQSPVVVDVKQKINQIIDNRCMKSIVFRYPRFAIKSYGKEKRYLCPPPHLAIKGTGWDDDQINNFYEVLDKASQTKEESQETEKLKGDKTTSSYYSIITIPGLDLSESGNIEFDEKRNGYATRIFIPDNKDLDTSIILNSMNSFAFSLTLIHSSVPICSFNSDYIKLKSKALSYTKQASNNASEDTCLTNGSSISLYSRIHSHKSNTRFLYIENSKFIAHPLYWESFIIYKVDENSQEADFEPIPGIINYGDYVKIVSTLYNMSLPCMQVFPVELKSVVESKPVQYLSRCSFRFKYNPSKFLSLETQRDLIAEEAIFESKKAGCYHVKEEAIWTITKISSSLYSFIELVKPQYSISPFPVVESIDLHGSNNTYYLKIRGINFTSLLSIWLGSVECGTFFQSKESMLAVMPQFNDLIRYYVSNCTISVPVFLIRQDLVMYPSQFNVEFTFNSVSTHVNDFVFQAKYKPFEEGLEDPEILSHTLLA